MTANLPTLSKRMLCPINTLLFSTLFPSSFRPVHGIFVETRFRELLKTSEVETKVVAPVPWFPFSGRCFGEYDRFATTPYFEQWNNIDAFHPRYFSPPKVDMNIAPLTANQLEILTDGENAALFNQVSPDCSPDTLPRLRQGAPFRRQQLPMASRKSIDRLKPIWTGNAQQVVDLAEKQLSQIRKREVT